MVNLNELWIGDQVKVVGEDEIGLFNGISNSGKALILIGKEIIEIEAKYLDLVKEEEKKYQPKPSIKHSKTLDYEANLNFRRTIDLHTEALDMNQKNHPMTPVIAKQIAVCKNYIQKAIDVEVDSVTIVHGKGIGALKSEIHLLLRKFPEVLSYRETNDGGATKVTFRY